MSRWSSSIRCGWNCVPCWRSRACLISFSLFFLGPGVVSAGYRLAAFDRIGSTNGEAMSRARDGEHGPMWFVTSEQTAGRGRRHRPWIAPRGNLASSILEVIDVSPAVAATLGFAAGLALEAAPPKGRNETALRAGGAGVI